MKLQLTGNVGRGGENRITDVKLVQALLEVHRCQHFIKLPGHQRKDRSMRNQIVVLQCSLIVLLGCVSLTSAAGGAPDRTIPVVDARAMEVGVFRHGETLWRYTRFNTESDYPCLRFEAIKPEQNWRVSDQRDVCEVSLPEGHPLVFDNTAYTGFTGIGFSRDKQAFHFDIEYMERTASGEKSISCWLPVTGGSLGIVRCQ